jgi:hypothetical protein
MKKLFCSLSLVALALALFCQIDAHAQLNRRPLDANQLALDKPPVNLERPSAVAAVPADMPNHFDPNVFMAKEQTHDQLIGDLLKRVGDLETTSSWLKGAIAGFLITGGLLLGFIKLFWKGIVTLILNEVNPPRALTP